jgi:hypothetical protein
MIMDYRKMGSLGTLVGVVDRRTGESVECYRADDAVGVIRYFRKDARGGYYADPPGSDRIADDWEHRDVRVVPRDGLSDDAREVVRRRIEEPEAFAREVPWIILEYRTARPGFLWIRPAYRWRARWDRGGEPGDWFPTKAEAAYDLLRSRSRGRLNVNFLPVDG